MLERRVLCLLRYDVQSTESRKNDALNARTCKAKHKSRHPGQKIMPEKPKAQVFLLFPCFGFCLPPPPSSSSVNIFVLEGT